MKEKIKSKLSALIKSRQVRLSIAAFLTALSVASATLLNYSIHTVKIFDGHETYTVRSHNNNVAMVMDSIALKSNSYDILETKTTDSVTTVKISYSFPVHITQGDNTTTIDFEGGTVKDALAQVGITPDEFDFVEPALDTQISSETYIDYTDINYIKTTKNEKVPHDTQKTYSDKLRRGAKKITVKGKDGVNQVISTQKVVNGKAVETTTQTIVISKPVSQKVTLGTKVAKQTSKGKHVSTLTPKIKIELDENGVPLKYKSKMKVRATAYTHTGNRCATGVKPKPGYIAVNPKVIPYGTKMFIKTTDGKYIYGYAVAADTGGFVKRHPTGVDLFFNTKSECRNFGVRTAEIYILE
ncbi:MAG: DUF348 domain-containing protein [Ruminococcaceae bacterium]|nr:DUF348 domain-containing protein [Oscillospiraceae bacterium]